MQLPILAPAPLVSQHAEAFKDLFENQKQYRHFQNYLFLALITQIVTGNFEYYCPKTLFQ